MADRAESPLKRWFIELFAGNGWALPATAVFALILVFYFSMTGNRGAGIPTGTEGESSRPSIASANDTTPRSLEPAPTPETPLDSLQPEGLLEESVQLAEEKRPSTAESIGESPAPSEAIPEQPISPDPLVAQQRDPDPSQPSPRSDSTIEAPSAPAEAPSEEILIASFDALGDPHYSIPSAADGLPFEIPDRNVVLRSLDPSEIQIAALAPRHAGRTVSRAPSLWWYLSRDTDEPIRFQLVDQASIDPVVERVFAGPNRAGFHSIDLGTLGVALEPGQLYEWSVMVEIDPERPVTNPRSYGAIVRLEEDPVPATISDAERAHAQAQAGIWYDAFATVAERVVRHGENERLVQQRTALLRSAGIAIPAVE